MISTLKLLKVINENTSFFFAISLSFTSFIQSTHIHTERRANKEDYAPKQHRYQNQGKSKKKKKKAVVFKTSKKVVGCFPFSCLFFPRNYFFFIHLREESHRAAVWLDRRCFCFADSSRTLEILC